MKNLKTLYLRGFKGWEIEVEETQKEYKYYLIKIDNNYKMFMYSMNKKQIKDKTDLLEILKSNLEGFTELYNQKFKNKRKD